MADKMAVMHGGVLQQYDTPERVFASPVNTFVAGFVGSPAMNLLAVRIDGDTLEGEGGWRLKLSPENVHRIRTAATHNIVFGARHSSITLDHEPTPSAVPARVYTVEPTGDITFAHVLVGTDTIVISVPPDKHLSADAPVWLSFDQRRLHFFDRQSGSALTATEGAARL